MSETKKLDLRNNNMFFLMSFRFTSKQVTGFSMKMLRWDIVEKIFRGTTIVQQLYKPKFGQAKENFLNNHIDYKKMKKSIPFEKETAVDQFTSQIYDAVNNKNSIVIADNENDNPVVHAFIKKHFPGIDLEQINFIDIPNKIPQTIETIDQVFYDVNDFKRFMKSIM